MVVGVWTLASPFFSAADETEAELRETGRLLAILLDSGRVTIGRNQALLNDPTRGEKGSRRRCSPHRPWPCLRSGRAMT